MREDLLKILKCIKCDHNSLSLSAYENTALETRGGKIVCDNCSFSYRIENGIADFLVDASKGALRERNAMDEEKYIVDGDGKKYKITDETIQKFKDKFLSLPEGDGSHFFKRGGSFQSIANSSSRFYSTLRSLDLKGRERVLELGACFSYASFKFAERGCSVVAIDISNYLKAADVFIEKAYFDRIFCDMHRMPFSDNAFDIVFGSAVLHHSKDLQGIFKEIRRVLGEKGRLVLINESARGLCERIHPVFEKKCKQGYGDTSYTLMEWKKGAREAGFKKVRLSFMSLVDDYITRHKTKGTADNFKLRIARFLKRYSIVEKSISFLFGLPRVLFRPKSWRMDCFK